MTSETPSRAYNSLFEAAAAAAAATEAGAFMAAEAAFMAAEAAFEAAGAAVEAAALAFAAAEAAALALAAAAAAGAAAAAVWAGAGAAAAACHGEAAPSARRKRLAITLTEAGLVPGFEQVRTRPTMLLQRFPCDARVRRAKSNRTGGEPIAKHWRASLTTECWRRIRLALAFGACGKVRVLTS
jgi:hypothetical protein